MSGTAEFTAPNGIRYAVTLEEGGLFVHVEGTPAGTCAEIVYEPNCLNEGWIKIRLMPWPEAAA